MSLILNKSVNEIEENLTKIKETQQLLDQIEQRLTDYQRSSIRNLNNESLSKINSGQQHQNFTENQSIRLNTQTSVQKLNYEDSGEEEQRDEENQRENIFNQLQRSYGKGQFQEQQQQSQNDHLFNIQNQKEIFQRSFQNQDENIFLNQIKGNQNQASNSQRSQAGRIRSNQKNVQTNQNNFQTNQNNFQNWQPDLGGFNINQVIKEYQFQINKLTEEKQNLLLENQHLQFESKRWQERYERERSEGVKQFEIQITKIQNDKKEIENIFKRKFDTMRLEKEQLNEQVQNLLKQQRNLKEENQSFSNKYTKLLNLYNQQLEIHNQSIAGSQQNQVIQKQKINQQEQEIYFPINSQELPAIEKQILFEIRPKNQFEELQTTVQQLQNQQAALQEQNKILLQQISSPSKISNNQFFPSQKNLIQEQNYNNFKMQTPSAENQNPKSSKDLSKQYSEQNQNESINKFKSQVQNLKNNVEIQFESPTSIKPESLKASFQQENYPENDPNLSLQSGPKIKKNLPLNSDTIPNVSSDYPEKFHRKQSPPPITKQTLKKQIQNGINKKSESKNSKQIPKK